MLMKDAPVSYWKKAGVYEIINTTIGRVYIGSTINLSKRRTDHAWRLKNGQHRNVGLQRDYNEASGQGFVFRVRQLVDQKVDETKQSFTRRLHQLEDEAIKLSPTVYNLRLFANTNAGLVYQPGKPRTGRGRGLRHPCAVLTAKQERAIRSLYEQGHKKIDLAKRYGVDPRTITRVINHPFTT